MKFLSSDTRAVLMFLLVVVAILMGSTSGTFVQHGETPGWSATSTTIAPGTACATQVLNMPTADPTPGVSAGVLVNPRTYPGDSTRWFGYMSGANSITVGLCGVGATATPSVLQVKVIP